MNRLKFWIFCITIFTTVYCDSLTLNIIKNTNVSNERTNNSSRNSNSLTGPSHNLLHCARKCKNDEDCNGLVYSETDRLCEVVNDNAPSNPESTPSLSGNEYRVTSRIETGCGQWKRVFSVNNSGGITYGDFKSLKYALLSGLSLHITDERRNNKGFTYTIISVFVTEYVICGQADGYVSIVNRPELVTFLLCTNGRIQNIRRKIGSPDIKVVDVTVVETSNWFVRETECLQALYGDYSQFSKTVYNQLKTMQAFILTLVQTSDTFTKIHYKTHANLIESVKHVMVTSVGEISKTMNDSYVAFTENSFWITTKYNFTSSIGETMCSLSVNKSCEAQVRTVNHKSYIDRGWRKVLHHTSGGISVQGSVRKLRETIMNGNRLLVHLNGHVTEPDIVFVDNDNITAVFTSYPVKQNISSDGEIVWEMLSTSGRYESLVFDITTGDILSNTNGSRDCLWFVENAKWTRVMGAEYNTTNKLIAAIESGSRLRIKANCLSVNNSSLTNYTCLYSPTMTSKPSMTTVAARTQMYPGISMDGSALHFAKEANPVWMSFELRAGGSSSTLRRNVWTHENSYFDAIENMEGDIINDVWYVN